MRFLFHGLAVLRVRLAWPIAACGKADAIVRRGVLAVLLGCFCLGSVSQAATWYVDNAAGGLRNGHSWANAWTNLNAAASQVAPGDTVYISGGTSLKYYRDPYWSPRGGTEGNPVTYKIGQDPGHNGIAVFDANRLNLSWLYGALQNVVVSGDYQGQNHFVSTNCTGFTVHLDGADHVVLDHVDVYGSMRFNPATNIIVAYCYVKPPPPRAPLAQPSITYAVYWGVQNPAGLPVTVTNNLLHNCYFHLPASAVRPDWGSDGIVSGRCTSVYSNYFTVYYVTNTWDWQHTDGWQNLGGSNCKLFANTFDNISNYSVYWECLDSVSNVFICNNLFRQNDTMAHASTFSLAVAFGAQNVSGKRFENIVIANNTIVDFFGRGAITFGEPTGKTNVFSRCVIANNLMNNSGNARVPAIVVTSSSAMRGIRWEANKALAGIRGSALLMPPQSLPTAGLNFVRFLRYAELSPQNDLRLDVTDGAAQGVGVNLSNYFLDDLAGTPRGSSWDLGAFQAPRAGSPIVVEPPTNLRVVP